METETKRKLTHCVIQLDDTGRPVRNMRSPKSTFRLGRECPFPRCRPTTWRGKEQTSDWNEACWLKGILDTYASLNVKGAYEIVSEEE